MWIRWLCFATLVLCAGVLEVSAQGDLWWQTAALYHIYPRSFKDSDGDGVGDLKGITQMVDYFKVIGLDAVWLSPIQTSPMVDFGYDISNFTDIDSIFGTMDDFKQLLKTVEDKNLKLILDFVPNHSSDQHPWFIKSVARQDPYTDFYVWSDGKIDPKSGNHTPPNNWISVFGGPAWEWNEQRQQFYLHQFVKQQPDLNFWNPAVWDAMEKVIRFWLDMGVHGFRLDSAKHLFEVKNLTWDEPVIPGTDGTKYADLDHIYTTNQNETYVLLERMGQIFHEYSLSGNQRVLLLEVYDGLADTMRYYGSGNTSLMIPFNFGLLGGGGQMLRASGYKNLIVDWMEAMPPGGVANWVTGNHDQPRLATICGPEMVDSINIMTGVLPGIKITYNGEEIGMSNTFIRWDQTVDPEGIFLGPDHYQEASRDPQRTPLQWDDSVSSGFSTNSTTWLPLNPNYWWLNIAAQKKAESSHLKVFQAMTQARKDPVLQKGNLTVLAPNNDTLLIVRNYQESYFILVINVGSDCATYTSQNLFAQFNLDMDVQIVTSSVNFNGGKVGDTFGKQAISLTLRPKSSVLLKSPPSASNTTTSAPNPPPPSPTSHSSSAGTMWFSLPLLCAIVFVSFSS